MGNDFLKAIGNTVNTIVKETKRAADEAAELMSQSVDDVGKAAEEGGLVGGALQAFEELSPGNFAAGAADVLTGPGQLDPKVAATIRGGVNLAVGALVPGPGLLLQAQALKDGATALGLLGNAPRAGSPEAQQAPGATQGQTPERPSEAAVRKGDSLIGGGDWRRGNIGKPPNGGYGPPSSSDLGGGSIRIDIGPSKPNDAAQKRLAKLEEDLAKADADIDKILSNPNLSFEDMIFMLMNAIISQSQKEVKLGLADEKAARDVAKGGRDIERNAIKAEGSSIAKEQTRLAGEEAGPKKDKALAALNERKTKLDSRSESLSTNLSDASESRAERFEELKNAMNKITEMQQALSNILNNMHQTAMSTIGNIR